MRRLISFGAVCGVIGGGVRIAAAFIPYTPETAWLEALYAVTDIGMLFGLLGVYLFAAEALGAIGFLFFVIAFTALASIVGPDARMFGIDFYRLGASAFSLALAALAAMMLFKRVLPLAALLWIACFALGLAASITGNAMALAAAGVALGAGYIAASISYWRQPV